ncbi:hypothetical protein TNCV_542481 [Trichonephila clavipes]|nr:hypothetical protein TNCV_542481 [Trichonephila clavipes]
MQTARVRASQKSEKRAIGVFSNEEPNFFNMTKPKLTSNHVADVRNSRNENEGLLPSKANGNSFPPGSGILPEKEPQCLHGYG